MMTLEHKLLLAIKQREINTIQSLLDQGASIHTKNQLGNTLIHLAVGSVDIMNLLLSYGAPIHEVNLSQETPLHIAADTGELLAVDMLLKKGAKVDAKDEHDRTPLHYAVLSQEFTIVEMLLKGGASLDIRDTSGERPLHLASELRTVEILLAHGAAWHIKNRQGETPLHTAAFKNRLVAEKLLRSGASPHVKDKAGNTPLHAAARFASDPLIIDCFIDKGAFVNVQNHKGETPLHLAARFSKSFEILEQLLDKKAITNIQNQKGKTPLGYVIELRAQDNLILNGKIIRLLLSYDAYSRVLVKSLLNFDLPYVMPISEEFLLSQYWTPPRSSREAHKYFYTTLLLAGIKPGYGHKLPQYLEPTAVAIETAVSSWLSFHLFKEVSNQINWQAVTPKVLRALPRLLHFTKRLANNTPLLRAGYTLHELKPFLFISSQSYKNKPLLKQLNWFIAKSRYPNPLLVLEAIADKQLPVELVTMIRDHLANWAMIDIRISDYSLENSVAVPLVLDVREKPTEYKAFHRQLLAQDY